MAVDTSQNPFHNIENRNRLAVATCSSLLHSSHYILPSKMKLVYVCAALAASLATTEAGGAVELSEDNFGKKMAGKNAIIKFLAPVSNTSAREQIQRGEVAVLLPAPAPTDRPRPRVLSNQTCDLSSLSYYFSLFLSVSLFSLSPADG